VRNQIKAAFNKEYGQRIKAGESMQDASSGAAAAVAKKFNMAYYEGTNGSLVRVTR
jgi:hypothetical protein